MWNFHGLIKTTVALKVNPLEYFTKCYKLSQTGPFRANRKGAVVCVRPILLAAKGCLCFLERSTTPQTTALGWQTSSEFRHPAWLCHLVSLHDFQPAFAWQPLFLCVRLIQKRTSNPREQAGAPGDKFALKKKVEEGLLVSVRVQKSYVESWSFSIFSVLFDKSWGKSVGNGNAAKNMKWAVTILSASLLLANLRRPTS